MDTPAFTTPCFPALTRSAFAGTSLSQCPTHASHALPRPCRPYPRMIGDDPLPSGLPEVDGVAAPAGQAAGEVAAVLADAPDELAADAVADVLADAGMPDGILDDGLGEDDDVAVEPCEPPQVVLNARAIAEARSRFKRHETDSGSPEFQIATLSTRITYLTNHLKQNPKDFSSTRGLLKMVSTRRRLLKYLKGQDQQRFHDIIAGLNIRVSQQLREL